MSTNHLEGQPGEIELIITDYQGSVIPHEPYVKNAEKVLRKFLINPKRIRRLKEAIELKRNYKKYSVYKRIREIVDLCEGINVQMAENFGKVLTRFIDDNIKRLFSIYSDVPRALISLDDRRVVEPTIKFFLEEGLPIQKYIVNEVMVIGGKMTKTLRSYASGVDGWGSKAIDSAKIKLDAFIAIIESYGVHPSKVLYVNDEDAAEKEIDDYMKKYGGHVIKSYQLPKLITPTLT